MQDYYDPGPRVALTRPIALTGFFGSGVAHTGRHLAAMLGLPFEPLEQLVEHRAGMSLARVLGEAGPTALRSHEAALLARLLRQGPPGVVVLGADTLLDAANSRLVAEHMQLVYVERPPLVLWRTLRRELAERPTRYPQLGPLGPDDDHELERLFERYRPGYAKAELVVQAGTRHPTEIGDALRAQLGLAL